MASTPLEVEKQYSKFLAPSQSVFEHSKGYQGPPSHFYFMANSHESFSLERKGLWRLYKITFASTVGAK
eukprot:1378337-Pleurochrysis_carterae.AAC.2